MNNLGVKGESESESESESEKVKVKVQMQSESAKSKWTQRATLSKKVGCHFDSDNRSWCVL